MKTPTPTPHQAFASRLLDLAYGELEPREAREVEGHAAACDACRTELLRIRETRRLMAALPEEPAPERGERILLAAAREAAERRAVRRRLPPWLLGAAAAAASLVVVAAVSYRLLAMRGPGRPEGEALLGESPYAAPAAAPAPPERAEDLGRPEGEVPAPASPAPSGGPALAFEKRRAAPPRDERGRRAFAEAPPAAGEARPAVEPRGQPARAAAKVGAPSAPAAVAAPGPATSPKAADRRAEASPATAPGAARAEEEGAETFALQREAQPARAGARPAPRAAEAPVASAGALAFAPPLRTEVRSFERCEGESRRSVETDAQGRVVRYVREGRVGGRRVRITHVFRPDGGLASVAAVDLDAGGAVDPRALGADLPGRAAEARLDAPPRCGG